MLAYCGPDAGHEGLMCSFAGAALLLILLRLKDFPAAWPGRCGQLFELYVERLEHIIVLAQEFNKFWGPEEI